MNTEEYSVFKNRLFIQFPSLTDWLERSSPDPAATQELWQQTLRHFSLDECLSVLVDWQSSSAAPFAAYERDQVACIVASCCLRSRDRVFRKREQDAMRADVEFHRSGGAMSMRGDLGMQKAFNKLQPLHEQMLKGELAEAEYRTIEKEVLAKL